jgi:hypothetical protein
MYVQCRYFTSHRNHDSPVDPFLFLFLYKRFDKGRKDREEQDDEGDVWFPWARRQNSEVIWGKEGGEKKKEKKEKEKEKVKMLSYVCAWMFLLPRADAKMSVERERRG